MRPKPFRRWACGIIVASSATTSGCKSSTGLAGSGGSTAVTADTPTGAAAARDAELSLAAKAVVDAFSNGGVGFIPGTSRFVFRSDRDGHLQLYCADSAAPDAPVRRLTNTAQRTLGNVVIPDGSGIVFQSDVGADDLYSLYRVAPDGSGLVELTTGEQLSRDEALVPRGTPGVMLYSARRLDAPQTLVFRQSIAAGSPPELVFESPGPGWLIDVSADGSRGLFAQPISLSDALLFVVDIEGKRATRLYPPEGQGGQIAAAKFGAGGDVLVATDAASEQAFLLAIDSKTGVERARYVERSPSTAQIAGLLVAPPGDRIVVQVDAGNHHFVRVLDAVSLEVLIEKVALPLGFGRIYDISEDGRRLALTWSTPQRPFDLIEVRLDTGVTAPMLAEPRPTLDTLDGLQTTIVEVESFDGLRIPVNVYLPKGPTPPLPVIVQVHGGPADASAIGWDVFVRFYTALGYAVVQPNVRGSTGFGRAFEQADDGPKRLDAVRDLEAVGRWCAAQPWADPDRLVVFGGSYGGYMVLMGLTRQRDLWRAGIDLVGPSSWRSFMASTIGMIREIFAVEIGDPEADAAFLDSISPLADAAAIEAPLFVFQGANDPRVPRAESDQIVASLRARGVPVEYMIADDEGHSLDRAHNKIAFLSRTARFLEQHLPPKRP